MAYEATCKECGKKESGEYWMDVQAKEWIFLEQYVDGNGETSKDLKWEWYCPEHQGKSIEEILKS